MDSLYSDSSRSRTEDSSNANDDDDYGQQHTLLNTMSAGRADLIDDEDGRLDNDDEEDDGEEITPAELIDKLRQCWLNEKFSPELLEHQTPVIECIIEQIKHMESNIKSAKKGDFRIALHKLELDRIKFMLCSYLRIRIKKIEQFTSSILEEDRKRVDHSRSKLSPEEFAYATEYLSNVKAHLTASVLDHLPVNLQDLNDAVTMPTPDHNKFIFFKSLTDIRGILIEDANINGRHEIIDVDKNDLYVMRYKPIGNHVISGQVQLI